MEHNVRHFCGDVVGTASRNDYGCAFFGETLMLGVATLIACPGCMFLVYKLSQVDDAFKLRLEMIWMATVDALAAGERTRSLYCSSNPVAICCHSRSLQLVFNAGWAVDIYLAPAVINAIHQEDMCQKRLVAHHGLSFPCDARPSCYLRGVHTAGAC